MVDDGSLCGQLLTGYGIDTHFQEAHGLVRTKTHAGTVFRLCPECTRPLIGWPEICRHLEEHLASVLDSLRSGVLDLSTTPYCPSCLGNDSLQTGFRLWKYVNVTERTVHVLREHIVTRPLKTPMECLMPECTRTLCVLEMVDHLYTDHGIKLTRGREGVTNGDVTRLAMTADQRKAFAKGRLRICHPS